MFVTGKWDTQKQYIEKRSSFCEHLNDKIVKIMKRNACFDTDLNKK